MLVSAGASRQKPSKQFFASLRLGGFALKIRRAARLKCGA